MKEYLLSRVRTLRAFPKQNGAVLISVIASMVSVLMIMAIGNGMASNIANQLKPTAKHKLELLYLPNGSSKLHDYDAESIRQMKGVKSVSLGSSTNATNIDGIFNNMEVKPSISSKDNFKNLKMVGKSTGLGVGEVWINRQATWLEPSAKQRLLHQKIFIDGKEYKISGVYETNLLDGGNLPDLIMNTDSFNNLGLSTDKDKLIIKFKLPSNETLEQFESNLLNTLSLQSSAGQDGSFSVLDDSLLSTSMHKLVKNISTFIVFISSMSLVVSGLSILNNSYANIAMRSPEIALRRVLGASKASIRNQFLIESLILLLFGIIVGSLLTEGIVLILNVLKIRTSLSLGQILVVGLVPLIIGMLSSVGPANLAASKNIPELLRTEYS